MKDSQQQRKQQQTGSDRVDTLTNPTQGSSKVHTVARTSSNGEKKKIEDKKQMQPKGGEVEDGAAAVLSIVRLSILEIVQFRLLTISGSKRESLVLYY